MIAKTMPRATIPKDLITALANLDSIRAERRAAKVNDSDFCNTSITVQVCFLLYDCKNLK